MALGFLTLSHHTLTWDSLRKRQKRTTTKSTSITLQLPDPVLPRTDIGLAKVAQSIMIAIWNWASSITLVPLNSDYVLYVTFTRKPRRQWMVRETGWDKEHGDFKWIWLKYEQREDKERKRTRVRVVVMMNKSKKGLKMCRQELWRHHYFHLILIVTAFLLFFIE